MKRRLDHTDDQPPQKRARRIDRISKLSDELLVRILSFLPVDSLIRSQRSVCGFDTPSVSSLTTTPSLSRKFNRIGGDAHLWKALYYDRFVRPRASRIPKLKESDLVSEQLHFSSKISKWLEEESLVKQGAETDWKRQYKLRHNWTRGSCNVAEIEVLEEPPAPPLLVRFHKGVIYTVDSVAGLRAFSTKHHQQMLSSYTFEEEEQDPPTALAVDSQDAPDGAHRIVVGFQSGRFSVYELSTQTSKLCRLYSHAPSPNGPITAVALSLPFLLTLYSDHRLTLYRFPATSDLKAPRILHSFVAQTVYSPVCVSLRQTPTLLTASLAYPLSSPFLVWKSGLQEFLLSPTSGQLLTSRTAFADTGPAGHPSPDSFIVGQLSDSALLKRPTSLSYSHPYLLMAHPGNTLTLSLVTSTPQALAISPAQVLWGHSSAVLAAHVSQRGRAVSVGRGDGGEVRVWELEGFGGRRGALDATSVIVEPGRSQDELPETARDQTTPCSGDLVREPGWVGFDEENVVVWKGREVGSQKVLVYNFA